MSRRKYPYITNALTIKKERTYSKTNIVWAVTKAEAIGLAAQDCEKQWSNEDGYSPPKVLAFMVPESDCVRIGKMVKDWPEKQD